MNKNKEAKELSENGVLNISEGIPDYYIFRSSTGDVGFVQIEEEMEQLNNYCWLITQGVNEKLDNLCNQIVQRKNNPNKVIDMWVDVEITNEDTLAGLTELSFAFSLSVPNEEALRIRDEVAFFQAVKAGIRKSGGGGGGGGGPTDEEYQEAIKQIVSGAIVSDKVIDIYSATGLKTPDISILSDEFLAEVKGLPHKNLAFEMLKRLLNDEVITMMRSNLVKSRSFAKMLEDTIKKYQNRTIEAAQVIAELVELAKKIRAEKERGKEIGLSPEEVAFYDALCVNESAIRELGDETLMQIAREMVSLLRKNTTIDWTIKENIQAKLRVYVKKLLRKYNYPPDKQESATKTVLEQANLLCKDWSGE